MASYKQPGAPGEGEYKMARNVSGNRIKHSLGERSFDVLNVLFFILLGLLMVLPFWNVIVISLTSLGEYMSSPFIILPKQPTLQAYQYVFATPLIPRAYLVTIVITLSATLISVLITSMLAYGLLSKTLHGHKFFMIFLLITMFFSGGMIPRYFVIKDTLGMDNSLWALILPGTVSVFNFIIIRSFYRQLPSALEESARIDGANDLTILFRIIYPLSIPTLATIALFVAVGHWNAWFNANLFIRDAKNYPLQLVIRNFIYKSNKPAEMQTFEGLRDATGQLIPIFSLNEEAIKMACVTLSVLPLLLFYPFVQKYFEKGVTIGAVKG